MLLLQKANLAKLKNHICRDAKLNLLEIVISNTYPQQSVQKEVQNLLVFQTFSSSFHFSNTVNTSSQKALKIDSIEDEDAFQGISFESIRGSFE